MSTSTKKRICKCPSRMQKLCCKKQIKSSKDVEDIIQALEYETEVKRLMKRQLKLPKFRTKPFKPPHFKDTCVPMVPSMHTRLRYIGHCPIQRPKKDLRDNKAYSSFMFDIESTTSDEDVEGAGIFKKRRKTKDKKKVRYYDLQPTDIKLPLPGAVIKHTESDRSMLNVVSPNTSGENIAAQKAMVKPSELRPPLPAKSGFDLYKPHSGIVINQDQFFVPDVVYAPGEGETPYKKKKLKSCHKGGICHRKSCNRQKCRKYAALRKKRMAKKIMRSRSGSRLYSIRGVRDGKPRARTPRHPMTDDDDPCGLDEIPRPEHAQIPMSLRKGSFKTHSLTVLPCKKEKITDIHYGILAGTFNMYDNKFGPRTRGRQALTMSVMAYCLAFHYHPKQWTMKLIDHLVDAGDQWYSECLNKVHDHSAVQGICEVLPFGKKQTLVLNGKRMQVLLCEPDIVGYTMSLDPTVFNLCRGLNAFFKENRAGILLTRVLKVVIWKDKVCYYIFDPAGRNSRAYSNFAVGTASLINVKDLEAVVEVLLARSVLEDQKFVLAPVKVLRMVDEKCDEDFESDKELTQAEKAMMGYRILTEYCAIVNANMHLGDRCFEEAKFRQALPIAIVAMTYAKISPPNTWFSKTLDKILRLGNKLYLDCVQQKVMIDLTIDNIPNEIIMGPYACEIIIYRERVKGQLFTTKECIFNIKTGVQDFFSREYNAGILEFNNYSLAIWRQKDMFYLFDPYPRTSDGLRSVKTGRACCLMLLNPESLADAIITNWNYLPATNQFYIHAFKVLKLKKKQIQQLVCTLSDSQLPGAKKRRVLPASQAPAGDARDFTREVLPMDILDLKRPRDEPLQDEEQMGDIISLIDSIQEDYVPPIPMKYKNMPPESVEPKIANLDSPTVSVTQVVPPWPKPRDKTNEPIEPDPEPEPTPPPTPPALPPPEGAEEEEELGEEEEDEETAAQRKEEEARKKAEEEARRKAEELPPPLPPPPPSPQPEPEIPLAPLIGPPPTIEDEVETMEPVDVDRKVLLTEDARYRFMLRQIRKKMTSPLIEADPFETPSQELLKPHNFRELPDNTQIIRGAAAVKGFDANDVLPFTAIMAIVTSYKYTINTWTPGIVTFIIDTAKLLHQNKKEKFQLAPVHIIPKIAIGHQAYHATIDVVGEGATWQLEDVLTRTFFPKYDRGMITTSDYSCAFFVRNGLYYLCDGSACDAMGLRTLDQSGTGCLMRFRTVHHLVSRIMYNKDGKTEDQQFILSRIVVRRLLPDARMKLPDDYDYQTRLPKSKKSKPTFVDDTSKSPDRTSVVEVSEPKSQMAIGYQLVDGVYKIEGTSSLGNRKETENINACHFVCLIAMLMATMHPIRTWDHIMIDMCLEKGAEIFEKANNLNVCEKRVIKNIILDGKFININIKKITVVNENPEKTIEQYLKAVLRRLRYVIIRFPECSMVICQTDGFFHLFDPYVFTADDLSKRKRSEDRRRSDEHRRSDDERNRKNSKWDDKNPDKNESTSSVGGSERRGSKSARLNSTGTFSEGKKGELVASWTLFRSMEALINRIKKTVSRHNVNQPEFYTFELTSVKSAPKHSALNYRLSPLFKPDDNPNMPYLRRRKVRPIVDEKMYWLNIDLIPWSRMSPVNDLGFERKTPKTLWKDWDIEFPGDLYSLWGTLHPMDTKFKENQRGKQYLAISAVALVMTQVCNLSAWTSNFLDGIVNIGDKYFEKCLAKIGAAKNYEMTVEDLLTQYDDMYPYTFSIHFENIIFGFLYNVSQDRFNLSKALAYFFERNILGILTSPRKNLAFGKVGSSYFMYDCQSYGAPLFSPNQGASYILKCESLNRLIYCMTVTLNVRRHGQQFHLYSAAVTVSEKK